ncbi:hypothetical protein HGA64_04110 [Candidatus Falkowbacteria bacterium]|nr:hypothetical protein [Candidatus Falkowbacteria bacterium]
MKTIQRAKRKAICDIFGAGGDEDGDSPLAAGLLAFVLKWFGTDDVTQTLDDFENSSLPEYSRFSSSFL